MTPVKSYDIILSGGELMLLPEKDINITGIKKIIYVTGGSSGTHISYDKELQTNELIFKISGENRTKFGDNNYHLTPGCVYFLPKGKYSCYEVDVITRGDYIDIFLELDRIPENGSAASDYSSNRLVCELFQRMERVWRGKGDGYYYKCMSYLYTLLNELTNHDRYLESSRLKMLDRAVGYIDEHFTDQEFNYEILAELSGFSYSYFKKLFLLRFGVAPREYITGKRIEYACELLESGKMSVSDIAELAGYENVYYFSNVFKQRVGVPPGQYMRDKIKNHKI